MSDAQAIARNDLIGEPAPERLDLTPDQVVAGIRHHAQCLRADCEIVLAALAKADDLMMQAAQRSKVLSAENMVTVNTPQGPKQITRGEWMQGQAAGLRKQAQDAMAGILRHGAEAGALIQALFEATGVKVL